MIIKDKNKNPKVLVILGSSRKESNTHKAVRNLIPFSKYDLVDLNEKKLCYYAYDSTKMEGDDFPGIAQQMLDNDIIVFASPVYWYAMSGQMKVFFDRLTQLTDEYKSIGKGLKGKKTYLIVAGGKTGLPEGFEIPFRFTSEYFDMEFVQTFYQTIL